LAKPVIIAIGYFAVLIIISSVLTSRKVKSAKDFTDSTQGLGWLMICFGFVLAPLGAGHTMNLWETATGPIGAAAMWWAIGAGGIFLPLATLWYGPWFRQSGCSTAPQIVGQMFGPQFGTMHAAFTTMAYTGIGLAETIATGTAIYGLSGGAIPLKPWCIIIAFVLLVLYVYFGGILQMAWLNVANSIALISGGYIALALLGGYLAANIGGWAGVQQIYESMGQANRLLQLEIANKDVWFSVILPVILLHACAASIAQPIIQTFFAARTDEDCRKGTFLGCGINIMAACPWVILALVGMVIPAVVEKGGSEIGKLVVPLLANEALPWPIVGWLMVSLMAATLSTGGGIVLGNANVLATDIIKPLVNPDMDPKTHLRLIKGMLILVALVMCIPAFFVPIVFPVFLWCFSFAMPVFFIYFIGLKFKASRTAAWITVAVAYIVNVIWTFWTPSWAVPPFDLNMYAVLVVSIVVGIISTAVCKGDRPLAKRRLELYAAKLAENPNY
jgi:SSS family solute:Na+ symporter